MEQNGQSNPWWSRLLLQLGALGVLLVVLYGVYDIALKSVVPITNAMISTIECVQHKD